MKDESVSNQILSLQIHLNRLALRLTGDREDANDLTQETLLKALESVCRFRGEASLKTWLCRILVNTYLTEKRRKKKHVSVILDTLPAPDWSANPEKVVVKRELQWCIQHTLCHHLPKRYAAALMLREFEGLPYQEIGEILGITPGAAKTLVHRSRRSFRRHLEKSGCYSYVRDYQCVCDGVREGISPMRG